MIPNRMGALAPGRQAPRPRQDRGQFRQYMQTMRDGYRSSMQSAGLDEKQVQQRMQAMRQYQRSNRSQYANQYMQERMQPPQQQQPWQQQQKQLQPGLMETPAQPGFTPQQRMDVYNNPTLSAEQQRAQLPANPSMPQSPVAPPSAARPPAQPARQNPYEKFNQRGRPAPSRANLLPAQQNTWKQRVSGGMRGAPASAPAGPTFPGVGR